RCFIAEQPIGDLRIGHLGQRRPAQPLGIAQQHHGSRHVAGGVAQVGFEDQGVASRGVAAQGAIEIVFGDLRFPLPVGDHPQAEQRGGVLRFAGQDRLVLGGGPDKVGNPDAGQAQQAARIGEVRMDLDDLGEQRHRRLGALGADEGVGEVIGRVGVVRTLADLGGQQWQSAFEVMPADQRQAIINRHVRCLARVTPEFGRACGPGLLARYAALSIQRSAMKARTARSKSRPCSLVVAGQAERTSVCSRRYSSRSRPWANSQARAASSALRGFIRFLLLPTTFRAGRRIHCRLCHATRKAQEALADRVNRCMKGVVLKAAIMVIGAGAVVTIPTLLVLRSNPTTSTAPVAGHVAQVVGDDDDVQAQRAKRIARAKATPTPTLAPAAAAARPTVAATHAAPPPPPPAAGAVPPFSHVFVIVMENHEYNSVIGNPAAPYTNGLVANYGLATNYFGVSHPSLPNYLALTAG